MSATSKNGLFAVCGSFIGLSTITVGLRLYGRRRDGSKLGIDDWSALFGCITYIGAAALATELAAMSAVGYGHPTPEQAAARAKPSIQISLAYDFLIMNTLACAKWSALVFYTRLFNLRRGDIFTSIIVVTATIIAAWYITFDALSLSQCGGHFSAFWDGVFKKYCDLSPVWAKGLAWSDFLLDLWVLLMPIPKISSLRTSKVKKLSIIGVFLLACVGLGASIARIAIFSTAKGPGRQTLYVGVLESGMIITVVNLPLLWFLFTTSPATTAVHDLQGRLEIDTQAGHHESEVLETFDGKTAHEIGVHVS